MRTQALGPVERNSNVTVAPPLDADPIVPSVLGGRWELVAPLARGGMGILYVGQHLKTGRRAAIKVIDQAIPDALARFRLEASVCAQVNHPGIVDVFDADLDEATGCCFIAMELLQGRTLRQVMEDPAATPDHVMGLLIGALEPLAAAHAKGFVHRDLKPENLFALDNPVGQVRVKLLDFGIVSRQAEVRLTRAGTAMGTPNYMSPEQATSAREAGPASDIWSVGVMMYEAIRGEVPFKGETGHGVIVQACTLPHLPLDVAVVGVDTAIARLIDRCLAKQPLDRPQDAAELAAELRSMLRPNSLPAARPSLPQRMRRSAVPVLITGDTSDSGVRPSLRSGSIVRAANVLAASGVVASLSALALPLTGIASPAAAFLVAAVGGGLLFGASARVRALRDLLKPAPVPSRNLATIALPRSQRPDRLVHPRRGSDPARVLVEIYADLTDALSRRICLRALALRQLHPTEIAVVWKPYWDPQREMAPLAAELMRMSFERDGEDSFWQFFDRLLNNTRRVNQALLLGVVDDVSPDPYGFTRALRTHAHRRSLQRCREEAESRGVAESPTIVLNGLLLAGEVSEDRLHWAYVDALSALECRRKVELETTRAEIDFDRPTQARALLIRYRGARNAPSTLQRTRAEARERASKLGERARMDGADFAHVAMRFADSLIEPEALVARATEPQFADLLARLRVGEISVPIECDEGFQVLQRLS
jgi:serine/threonine protein kinase